MASQAVQLERTEITLESPDETPAIIDVSKTISWDVDEFDLSFDGSTIAQCSEST